MEIHSLCEKVKFLMLFVNALAALLNFFLANLNFSDGEACLVHKFGI